MKTNAVKISVSLPADLLAQAEAKATEQRRSLSNYFQVVIEADVENGNKSLAA